MRDRVLGSLLLLTLLASGASAQLATFGDDTFAPGGPGCEPDDGTESAEGMSSALAGYTMKIDVRFGAPGYTCFNQRSDDGNPAPYAHVVIKPNVLPGGGQTIACLLKDDAVYDPAVSGAIGWIEHREDAKCFVQSPQCMSTGACLVQDGNFYFARAGFVPEMDWTPKTLLAGPADFSKLSGAGPSNPDFSAGAPPLQFGFHRAKSGGSGEDTGLDNWQLTLHPPCTGDGDCDDADACTTDVCTDGVCARTPMDCDDGDDCTDDSCSAGACQHTQRTCDDADPCTLDMCVSGFCQNQLQVDFATIDAKLAELIAIVEASPCGAEDLVRKLVRKLKKKLKKAQKKLAKADRATKDVKIARGIDKASVLLGKAQLVIAAALGRELISPACAAVLGGLVSDAETCVFGLPRPPV